MRPGISEQERDYAWGLADAIEGLDKKGIKSPDPARVERLRTLREDREDG